MSQLSKQAPKDLSVLLHESKDQIAKALPKHLTPDRMLRICLTEIRKNPKLKDCDPFSFMGAVIQAAQLGLEPGSGLGHAYLVPYGKQVTFIPGYKGLVDLARRSGRIKAMHSYLVYPDDQFQEGVRNGVPFIDFIPARTGKPRSDDDIRMAFAVAEFDGGGVQWTVMEKWEIDKIRDGLRYVSDVWKLHYAEMAKKTAIRRLCKMLPQSPELVQAQEMDDLANDRAQRNHQVFIDAGVLEASYNPEPVDPEKNREVHAAPDVEPPDAIKRADALKKAPALEQAHEEFKAARAEVEAEGMSASSVIGATLKGKNLTELLMSTDPKVIYNLADILKGAVRK